MLIYHVVKECEWRLCEEGEDYEAESLYTEGFIHCSFQYQLEDVLRKYFADEQQVIILHINPFLLRSEIIVEPATNGEFYPHVYGRINRSAVIKVEERMIFFNA